MDQAVPFTESIKTGKKEKKDVIYLAGGPVNPVV